MVTSSSDAEYDYTLLELPKDVAALFESGDGTPLVIRGGCDSDAVLCAHNTAYSVRLVSTSNTLLLAKEDRVVSTLSVYAELAPASTAAAVAHVRALLADCAFSMDHARGPRVSLAQLYEVVQASDTQIRAALEECGAFEFDACVRTVDPVFLNQFIQLFIAAIDIFDKDTNALTKQDALDMMAEHEIPDPVIEHCLTLVGEETVAGSGIYALSHRKICRITGSETLMSLEAQNTPINEFMKLWRKATPSSFDLSLDHLQGIYLIEGDLNQTINKSALPASPKERLEYLFTIRRKWAANDIRPYIEDLAENKKKLDLLLLKYARLSRAGDIVYYSAR
ncbi:sister chromatid cohesion protein Dcc1 [Chytriomyces sp. MP71]|nr:sister chromatid cohesion protein Dcc1 [Chytriomyces sp. MP71]